MVRKRGSLILCGAFLFVACNGLLLLFLWGRPPSGRFGEGGGAEPGGREEWGVAKRKGGGTNLAGEVIRLAEEVESELETQKELLKQIQSHRSLWEKRRGMGRRRMDGGKVENQEEHKPSLQLPPGPPKDDSENKDQSQQEFVAAVPDLKVDTQPDNDLKELNYTKLEVTVTSPQVVIPILVIACDRVTVKRSLDKLIQYRPSAELYPIIVSQDCGHAETARVIGSYGSQVTHISQPDLSDIRVRPEHRKFQGYYKIARHYRWALNQVFNTLSHSTVVIVEDDLEVSEQ